MSAANLAGKITSGYSGGESGISHGGYNPKAVAAELDADRLGRQIETAPPQYTTGPERVPEGYLALQDESRRPELMAAGVNLDALPPTTSCTSKRRRFRWPRCILKM